jgi:AcrR family transcriptional regulator
MAAQETTRRLIVAAERLFAERGIADVSLRQIAEAAGQRNPAVVQYHFGSKLGLLRAIVEFRVKPFNERRLELLAGLDADGRADDLRGLVDASVRPLAELESDDSHYVRFLAQLTVQGSITEVFAGVSDEFLSSARLIEPRMEALLLDLPPQLRTYRLSVTFSTALFAIAQHHEHRASGAADAVPLDLFVEDLVAGITGFLRAPAPADATARLAPVT